MDKRIVSAVVLEALPNSLYKVALEDKREFLCYVSGKMRHNHVHVLVGDTVRVELDPYRGKTSNRIIERE